MELPRAGLVLAGLHWRTARGSETGVSIGQHRTILGANFGCRRPLPASTYVLGKPRTGGSNRWQC
jgi:hypothetical protein